VGKAGKSLRGVLAIEMSGSFGGKKQLFVFARGTGRRSCHATSCDPTPEDQESVTGSENGLSPEPSDSNDEVFPDPSPIVEHQLASPTQQTSTSTDDGSSRKTELTLKSLTCSCPSSPTTATPSFFQGLGIGQEGPRGADEVQVTGQGEFTEQPDLFGIFKHHITCDCL
jgi:hypothetical protein